MRDTHLILTSYTAWVMLGWLEPFVNPSYLLFLLVGLIDPLSKFGLHSSPKRHRLQSPPAEACKKEPTYKS